MFRVGDRIAHPMHGAGVIREIVQQRVDGEDRCFYSVEMITGSMRVFVPCDACDALNVREIVSAETAAKALEGIPSVEICNITNWNQRYRENMAKLKSGELDQIACVIKSLTDRDRKKGLSTGERKILNCARNNFLSELSLAMDVPMDEITRKLDKALRK